MAKPVVVYVSHTGDWGGGGEACLRQLIIAARRAGYSPELVAPAGELGDRLGPLSDHVTTMPIPWLRRTANPVRALTMIVASTLTAIRLARIILRSQPLVVHANSGVSALVMALPCLVTRCPLVWHQHDLVPPRLVNRIVLATCGRLAASILATSGAVANSLQGIGVPAERLTILYPRIDDTFFDSRGDSAVARRVLGLPEQGAVLTVIGRIVPRKGHGIFLDMLERLLAKGTDAHGVVLGEMPKAPDADEHDVAYAQDLKRRACSGPLRDRVSFLGHRDDVGTILAASDILVMPSPAEPFGRVIIEAFASSVPVVASASGGPLEVIDDGKSGLLVPPTDAAAFASAVDRLLHDRQLYLTIAQNAATLGTERFSEDGLVSQLSGIYARFAWRRERAATGWRSPGIRHGTPPNHDAEELGDNNGSDYPCDTASVTNR